MRWLCRVVPRCWAPLRSGLHTEIQPWPWASRSMHACESQAICYLTAPSSRTSRRSSCCERRCGMVAMAIRARSSQTHELGKGKQPNNQPPTSRGAPFVHISAANSTIGSCCSSQAVMGFLDRLAGRNAEQREAEEPAQPSAELLSDSGSSSASLGGALSSAVPDYSPAQSPASDGQQSTRLYNPYQVGSSRPANHVCPRNQQMH